MGWIVLLAVFIIAIVLVALFLLAMWCSMRDQMKDLDYKIYD